MDILFVVSDAATPPTPDVTLRDWMVNTLGHSVTYISDETAEASAASYDLAIISETCTAATLGSKYKTWTQPVLVLELAVWDDHDLAASGTTLTTQSQFDILAAGDPIAAGLTGAVTFTTSGTTDICWAVDTSWGPDAVPVIGTSGSTTQIVAGRYEKGATGTSSFVMPARRVALGYNQDTINHNNFDDADLRAVFEACIDWLTAPINAYEAECIADDPVFLLPMDEASGNLTDLVHGKTATANGSPTYAVTGPVTGKTAVDFPASADYFTVADHADLDLGDSGFSIEVWFARDDDINDFQGILNKGSASYAISIDGAGTAGYEDKLIPGKVDTSVEVYSDNTVPTDGSWHHYVWTRGASSADTLYVDGVESGTDAASGQTLADTTSVLTIGRETASFRAGGKIAYIALYKSVLSASRILAHYNAAFAVTYVQHIGDTSNGTASQTSTVLSVSKTITDGNSILVGIGLWYDPSTTTDPTCADNLGNTYTLDESVFDGIRGTHVFRAVVDSGTALTSITVTHQASDYVTMIAEEFSGVGTLATDGATTSTFTSVTSAVWDNNRTVPGDGMAFGMALTDSDVTPSAGAASGSPSLTPVLGTYRGDGTNISGSSWYALAGSSDHTAFSGNISWGSSVTGLAAGANYNAYAESTGTDALTSRHIRVA
jgi:hypothetical protein